MLLLLLLAWTKLRAGLCAPEDGCPVLSPLNTNVDAEQSREEQKKSNADVPTYNALCLVVAARKTPFQRRL